MNVQSVVFYASPFMYFIGLVHQLIEKLDVKIHLIYFSSTLVFAALKIMSNFHYKSDMIQIL